MVKCIVCGINVASIFDNNEYRGIMCDECYEKEIGKGNIVDEIKNADGTISYLSKGKNSLN